MRIGITIAAVTVIVALGTFSVQAETPVQTGTVTQTATAQPTPTSTIEPTATATFVHEVNQDPINRPPQKLPSGTKVTGVQLPTAGTGGKSDSSLVGPLIMIDAILAVVAAGLIALAIYACRIVRKARR